MGEPREEHSPVFVSVSTAQTCCVATVETINWMETTSSHECVVTLTEWKGYYDSETSSNCRWSIIMLSLKVHGRTWGWLIKILNHWQVLHRSSKSFLKPPKHWRLELRVILQLCGVCCFVFIGQSISASLPDYLLKGGHLTCSRAKQ